MLTGAEERTGEEQLEDCDCRETGNHRGVGGCPSEIKRSVAGAGLLLVATGAHERITKGTSRARKSRRQEWATEGDSGSEGSRVKVEEGDLKEGRD